MTAKNKKFIHELKGPAILTPIEIKDILELRPQVGARKTLAQKYGVSEKRIANIWCDYYGGGTLKDFATGLKKPLPTVDIKNTDFNMRKIKTERAEYAAKMPKTKDLDRPDTRARSVRKVPVVNKDLELNTDEITDADAQIIAGQVRAGNNNEELIALMTELIHSNKQLSESAVNALKVASITYQKRIKQEKENINDNIESFDDSTAAYKKKLRSDPDDCPSDSESCTETEYSEESAGYRDMGYSQINEKSNIPGYYDEPRTGIESRRIYSRVGETSKRTIQPTRSVQQRMDNNKGLRIRTTGREERAKPIYKTQRRTAESDEECSSNIENSGHEQAVSNTKYNPRETSIQSDNSNRNNKRDQKPSESRTIPGRGGVRPSQNLQPLSWLKRPI